MNQDGYTPSRNEAVVDAFDCIEARERARMLCGEAAHYAYPDHDETRAWLDRADAVHLVPREQLAEAMADERTGGPVAIVDMDRLEDLLNRYVGMATASDRAIAKAGIDRFKRSLGEWSLLFPSDWSALRDYIAQAIADARKP